MEAGFSPVEQGGCGLSEPIPIGPKAMASELLLEESPDALKEIQVRTVRGQPEREHPALLGRPPRAHGGRTVIADVVEYQHQIVPGPRVGHALQKGGEAGASPGAG